MCDGIQQVYIIGLIVYHISRSRDKSDSVSRNITDSLVCGEPRIFGCSAILSSIVDTWFSTLCLHKNIIDFGLHTQIYQFNSNASPSAIPHAKIAHTAG